MKNSLLVILIFLIGVFWTFLLPGPRVANDYHYFFKELSQSLFERPFTWREVVTSEGLGEYSVSTLWSWPTNFVYGMFAMMGLNYSSLFRFFGILPFLGLGIFGISKLLDYYKMLGWGKIIGIIFYLTNSYVLLLIDGGQINLALAYTVLPLVIFYYRRSVFEGKFQERVKFSLSLLLLSIFDFRIVYFVALLIGFGFVFDVFFSYQSLPKKIKNYAILVLIASTAIIGFHAYWILPSILVRVLKQKITYDRQSQLTFLSFSNIGHSMLLLAPNWFKNLFGNITQLKWEFVFIPILVFLAPVLRKRDRTVSFWLVIVIFAIFLSKGINLPLGNVYSWLFSNVPGFSLFRDPSKFYFFVALSFSILIGISINEISKKAKKVPLIILLYLFLIIHPAYTGKMTGLFSKPVFENEYIGIAKIFQEDKAFSRSFWIPTKNPFGYYASLHPATEAFGLLEKRPFTSSVIGTYELFNYLRQPYMGQLFDIAGIKYLSYPYPDTRRENLKQDNIDYYYWLKSKISNFSWINTLLKDGQVPLFETKNHQDKFFVANNTTFVVGSDRIYKDYFSSGNLNLSQNALIFLEEKPGGGNIIQNFPESKIYLYDKNNLDLAATFVDGNNSIFPAKYLNFSPSKQNSWWKRETSDLVSWRGFLQQKYGIDNQDFDFGGGWAVSEGSNDLRIKNNKLKESDILLARVMTSSRGGKLEFLQGANVIGSITTKEDNSKKVTLTLDNKPFEYDKANFQWFEVGKLKDTSSQLTVRTRGSINVVNAFVVVSQERLNEYKNKAEELLQKNKINSLDEVGLLQKPDVSYQEITPTEYRVTVKNLKIPSTLVFSMNYDSLWQMNGKSGVEVYSFLNGFPVNNDGTYSIIFSAQKYVLPGLAITVLSLVLIVLKSARNAKKNKT